MFTETFLETSKMMVMYIAGIREGKPERNMSCNKHGIQTNTYIKWMPLGVQENINRLSFFSKMFLGRKEKKSRKKQESDGKQRQNRPTKTPLM